MGLGASATPLAAAAAPAAAAPAQAVPARAAQPNIILIVADDLGYSDLSAFGSEIQTPNLDALGARGMQLTNFHTSPTCSPTRAMLLTGTDNHIAGVGTMAEEILPAQKGKPGYEGFLTDRVATLPAILRQGGYHTFMAGKWHLGVTEAQSPAARGFDKSFALLNGGADHFDDGGINVELSPKAAYREDGKSVPLPNDFGYSTTYYTDRMIGYIDSVKDGKPFFGYLAYTAPHWPLQVPDRYLDRYRGVYDAGYDSIAEARLERLKAKGYVPRDVKAYPGPGVFPGWASLSAEDKAKEARRMEIYAAMVTALDDQVGRLIAHLKATGRYDNTIIMFFSDNGAEGSTAESISAANARWIQTNFDNSLENMGKRGSFIGYGPNWARVSAAPFRMFKAYTYEGGIRSPAIVVGPGVRAGARSDAFVNVKDVAPTLLEAAGVEHPSVRDRREPPMQGRSALAFLEGRAASVHGPTDVDCLELFGRVAVRQGRFKLTYSNPPWGAGRWELYDIVSDPAESRDLSRQRPQELKHMLVEWDGCMARNGIVWTPEMAGEPVYGNTNHQFGAVDARTDPD
jgi:arylsulfatase